MPDTLSAAVESALAARKDAMRGGPRTVADLARALGMRPSTLHIYLTGRRTMPAHVAAAIRAALPEMPIE